MKKKGTRQLLPTPQTSTTSTTSWIKDDFGCAGSSEIDVILLEEEFINNELIVNGNLCVLKSAAKDNLNFINTFTFPPHFTSSWPFRSLKSASTSAKSPLRFNEKVPLDQLNRAVSRDFPYFRVLRGVNGRIENLLFDRELWKFLLNISTIYSGSDAQGDRQKRNEIAFAAWTTILRVYSVARVHGAIQLYRFAVAAVTLQAKLLEEADVDLVKLERKLAKLTKFPVSQEKIKATERKISSLLHWKLLTPSPQVFLFLCMDVLSTLGPSAVPASLKLLVSKVLDVLIQSHFIHEYLRQQKQRDEGNCGIAPLVVAVLEIVLDDFFSAFPASPLNSKSIQGRLPVPAAELSDEFKRKIGEAIETIMNEA